MQFVADDRDGAVGQRCGLHAAAYAAICASGAYCKMVSGQVQDASRSNHAARADNASPNNRFCRIGVMSVRFCIRPKYHGPSLTSPYNTAPVTRLSFNTKRL